MRRLLAGIAADPDFAKLWSGGFVSTLGFHISALAMQLTAAIVLGAGPVEVGILGACGFLPRFVIGLAAGAWIDRMRKRPILIVADLGRAALLASIPIAHVGGWLSMPQLYVVTLGMGTFSTFFESAIVSYLPSLVGRERLLEANSRLHAGEAIAQIGGPNLAGALVQWLTAPIAIGLDAASYVGSAVFIGWIRRPEPPSPPREARRPLLLEIREGLAAVTASPVLRSLIAAGVNQGFFTGGIRGSLIVLYLVEIGVTPLEFGLIYGVGGASALVGALIATRVSRALGLGPSLVAAHLVMAAFAACVPLAGAVPDLLLPVLLAGQVGLGLSAPVWGVNGGTLQQAVTPDRLLGRVSATQRFAVFGIHPVAALLGGSLAAVIGLQLTLLLAAAGAALGAVWLALSPIRTLEAMPAPVSDESAEPVDRPQ